MKDLANLTDQELEAFFCSFDTVLSDLDGVVRNFLQAIPGSIDAVKFLKRLGKDVFFVTNNTTKTVDMFHQELSEAGLEVNREDIVTPVASMISYLRQQNIDGKRVFVLGTPVLKRMLEESGFVLAPNEPDRIQNTAKDFAALAVIDDDSVGAVIADVDFNVNYVNLQRAATYLERPEVVFVAGPTDMKLPVGRNKIVIGPGFFVEILENMTERSAAKMTKPSPYLNEYIVEKYGIEDRSRVLFIGDSIPEDMGFAGNCGYKKLLVLSGLSSMSCLDDWKFEEKWKPDFYVESLKQVHELGLRVFGQWLDN